MHTTEMYRMPGTIKQLSPLEQEVAQEFARRVRDRFGERVLDIRVFGSRARGEARVDSDLDVWVLLEGAERIDREAICDVGTDLLLEGNLPFPISARVMSREQYDFLNSLGRLLPQEIERDGIAL